MQAGVRRLPCLAFLIDVQQDQRERESFPASKQRVLERFGAYAMSSIGDERGGLSLNETTASVHYLSLRKMVTFTVMFLPPCCPSSNATRDPRCGKPEAAVALNPWGVRVRFADGDERGAPQSDVGTHFGEQSEEKRLRWGLLMYELAAQSVRRDDWCSRIKSML